MEQSSPNKNSKLKQKKSISKLLLPKAPNRVGVLHRTQSADNKRAVRPALEKLRADSESPQGSPDISHRPLSLDIANMAPKKKENPEFIFSAATEEYLQYSPKQEQV